MTYAQSFSPIRKLGYPDMKDYYLFKRYLFVPRHMQIVALQMYRNKLNELYGALPSVVKKCNELYWRKLVSSISVSEKDRLIPFKSAGVPAIFLNDNSLPNCGGDALKVLCSVEENIKEISDSGRVLYFHSTFETQAMLAGSRIVKAAVSAKVDDKRKPFMVDFPTYMQEIRKFEPSEILRKAREAKVLCLSLIGCEYVAESGFTEATLMELIRVRGVSGSLTVLSSNLEPKAFEERYKVALSRLGAVVFSFQDNTVKNTIVELAKDLARIEKAKGGA